MEALADLDRAVEGALVACFLCAGQSCTAGERLLVHSAIKDEFATPRACPIVLDTGEMSVEGGHKLSLSALI